MAAKTLKYFAPEGISGLKRTEKKKMGAIGPLLATHVGFVVGKKYLQDRQGVAVLGKATAQPDYMIENALTAGLLAAGMNVRLLGPMPTPAVSMLVRSLRADVGLMISVGDRSHNKVSIKLFGPDGLELSDEDKADIDRMLCAERPEELGEGIMPGKAKRVDGPHDRYIEYAKRTLPTKLEFTKNFRVVVDCANGATYKVVPEALRELGIEVVAMNIEPNGTNINQDCGFVMESVLRGRVHEVRADIGFAFNGDGSEIVVMSEAHHEQMLTSEEVETILSHGRKKWEKVAELNGSAKGDGLVAALQILAVLQSSDKKLSKLVESLMFQPLKAVAA